MTVSLVVERAMAHRRGDLIGQHGCAMLDPLAGISAFAQLVEGKPFARTTVAAMPTQAAAR